MKPVISFPLLSSSDKITDLIPASWLHFSRNYISCPFDVTFRQAHTATEMKKAHFGSTLNAMKRKTKMKCLSPRGRNLAGLVHGAQLQENTI